MTEYEMLAAAQGQANIAMNNLINEFSIMAAYLVAGYFAAHRISFPMALFVTTLFVLVSLNGLALQSGTMSVALAVMDHMHAEAAAGKAFAWWPTLARRTPGISIVAVYVGLFVSAAAIMGSVYFFFECRWRNMKAEAAAKV